MNFTEIPDIIRSCRDVPVGAYGVQSTLYVILSDVVQYVADHYRATARYRRSVIDLINTISYHVVNRDTFPEDWSASNPFEHIQLLNSTDCEADLGSLLIRESDIIWDLEETNIDTPKIIKASPDSRRDNASSVISVQTTENVLIDHLSTKEDVSFEFPKYPSFNISKVWAIAKDEADRPIPIYATIPEIPNKQREISMTTDISKMSRSSLLRLYPNTIIHTRREEMYSDIPGFQNDSLVGFIPTISGFTPEEVKDNIIKYPQFHFMFRIVDGERVSFMKHIEIDGELVAVSEAIKSVSDIQALPHSKYFVWDYIVRRYLLERDIKGIRHKYPLFGSFDPFMTLFMPAYKYAELGYADTESLVRKCVGGRVRFYMTRNPLVRRMMDESELSSMHI